MFSLLFSAALSNYYRDEEKELIELLFEAIPEEDKRRLSTVTEGAVINGGTSRGWKDKIHAVATYNNTIPGEQGIIDWFERALVGIKS